MAWKFLTSHTLTTKGISLFYSPLQNKDVFTKSPPMIIWKWDLRQVLTDDQWKMAICYSQRVPHCINHCELSQKILSHWYFTQHHLAKFSPSNFSLCWRGCRQTGTIKHILWTGKGLTSYWNRVFKLVSQITVILTEPNPALALLFFGIECFPLVYCTSVVIIRLTSKLLRD